MELRRAGVVVVAAALAVGGVATLVGAHGTHLTVGPQVVADGTVVVDSAATTREGFLVVHTDDGGRPGDPIGHAAVGTGVHEDFRIGVDGSLPDEGATTLWAVVHADENGDGTFDPGTDTPMRTLGGVAGDTFRARSGDRPVFVTGLDTEAQGANETVLVTGVGVAERSHLVLRTDENGRPGAIVGNVTLSPGIHRNVEVPVDPDAYPERRGYLQLWAVVHADDGDGTFDPESDGAVTVDGRVVGSLFSVEEVPASAVERPTATSTRTATATGNPGTGTDSGTTGGTTPGYGALPAVLGVAMAALVGYLRRDR